ncbi:hypothetical protein J31TS4_34160 [Paenibacillus sp. J31TS4]|uniref:GNAT family N-acetyltransferase n=1 Tax=Paenibacillus sp. J31TS4 TaxID=2807195 RepID=UPI001B0ED13F|nr:GNAT family N-acetyltransferase [Paenibacillus sp. J31TS4]GIP40136.1 hypothetical protein J31TS4_34160 [Paenibacillus sp. J31TS4]
MSPADDAVTIRPYTPSDAETIAALTNREPFHLLNGITGAAFDRMLDEPGERIREHTYVAEFGRAAVGYCCLCFVEREDHLAVFCYGAVDPAWRRRGVGSALFRFLFALLEETASRENKPIRFLHRAVSRIPGEAELAAAFGMQEQNRLEVLCLPDLSGLSFPDPPGGLGFRSPALSDAAEWAALYNDAFGGGKTAKSVAHEFQGEGFSPDRYLFCTDTAGTAVGLLCATRKGRHARIPTLAVRTDWQRRGVGTALLAEILKRLKEAGMADVRLSVDSRNQAAKTLYRRFGFRPDYERIHYAAEFGGAF